MSPPTTVHLRVAFLGFSEFERGTLASYFRLAGNRSPSYEQVQQLNDADYLVADADHSPSVQLVIATERLDETVFIGSQAPVGAKACMLRPIDPLHVMRQLDALVAVNSFGAEGDALAAAARTTVIPVPRRPRLPEPVNRLLTPSPPTLLERAAAVATPPPSSPVPAPAAPRRPAPTMFPPVEPRRGASSPPEPQPQPQPPLPLPSLLLPANAAPQAPMPQRALLVDDSEIALRFLETRLKPWGLQIDRAANSAKAGDMLARRNYDFVFLDVELGADSELDGLGLCQQIKQTPMGMTAMVVMVSAHHSELDRVRGVLAGCDAYLAKPLDENELARLLKRQGLKPPAPPPPPGRAAGAKPG